jgi:hypothetical protein
MNKPSFVKSVIDDKITIENIPDLLRLEFSLQAAHASVVSEILAKTIEEQALVFNTLRNHGVCFSYGRDWSPSELFQYFREQKLITGSFKEISWRTPDEYIIREI